MQYRRRDFVKAAFGAMLTTVSSCAVHNRSLLRCPSTLDDFVVENNLGPLRVYRCKARVGPPILLLHELPGMSPANLSLAHCLAKEGFSVFLPLLFGEPGQDRFFAGYLQSCGYGDFECSALSGGSPILTKLREVLDKLIARERGPVGIIGMCMTGALPIALLGGGVEAAVLCQPTLPFNVFFGRPVGKQKEALGLNDDDINRAKSLKTPLLALRYATDRLSPAERMNTLRDIFQQRIATIEIGGERQGHSTLAGDLDEDAFADAVNYLKVLLGVEKRSREMKLAKLHGRRCEITAEGQWRAL
jgi:dienelactone hydrolase